jgi:hypothetical protein
MNIKDKNIDAQFSIVPVVSEIFFFDDTLPFIAY